MGGCCQPTRDNDHERDQNVRDIEPARRTVEINDISHELPDNPDAAVNRSDTMQGASRPIIVSDKSQAKIIT